MVTNEASKVPASRDHSHSHPLEVLLQSLDIPRVDYQYALSHIRGLSMWRSPHQKFPHVLLQGIKHPSHSCVFRIPQLQDVGIRGADIKNEQEDPNALFNHGQEIPMGHTFLDLQ